MRYRWVLILVVFVFVVVPVSATVVDIYTTNDLNVYRYTSSMTFPTIRGYSSGDVSTNYYAGLFSHASSTDNYTEMDRPVLLFQTAALPDDAIISAATIKLWIRSKASTLGNTNIGITKFNIDGAVDAADYNNFDDDEFTDTRWFLSDWTTAKYYDFQLNSLGISNISLTDQSGFMVRTGFDINNTAPSPWVAGSASVANINSTTIGINPPYIEITYTSVSESIPESISNLTNTPASNCTTLIWNWTNPADISNLGGIKIYKDGVYAYTLSNTTTSDVWVSSGYYGNESHTISTKTVNLVGGENSTFVNATAKTTICAAKTWPKVMIMFDDGWNGVHDYAFPIFSAVNFNATVYAVPGYIATGTHLDVANMTELYNAGWDIANHGQTHGILTGMTSDEMEYQIEGGQENLTAWGFNRSAYHYAYAGGSYNATVIAAQRLYCTLTARAIWENSSLTSPYANLLEMAISDNIGRTEPPTTMINHITGKTTNQTVPLLFHQILPAVSCDELTEYPAENMSVFVTWLYDNGYTPITISEWYAINDVDTYTIPVAGFSADTTYGYVPLPVTFTDSSTNIPTQWNWSFGDGQFSTLQNPVHTYTHSGLYNVSLNATNCAGSDTETKVNYINVSVMPNVIFSGVPLSGGTPLTVTFTDASTTAEGTIDTWNWIFGDGSPNSTTQNPTHTFTTSGLYSISLTVTNSFGISNTTTYTNYISASTPGSPTANFHGTPTSGTAPLTVTFFDDSTSFPTSWNWSFGDGQFSTLQNPVHTYSAVGVYTVSLNATNAFGSDVFLVNDYINVTAAVTPTQTPSNATGGTRGYSAEETAIPFWLWAVIIILGSALLIAGLFGRHLIFGIMSTMCFAAAAFASPMVSFFYQEVVLSNESEVAYSVFPMKWLVTQPWVAWLLWGMALLALLVVVYGVIVGMAEIKKPGDEFLEDDWLDRREF